VSEHNPRGTHLPTNMRILTRRTVLAYYDNAAMPEILRPLRLVLRIMLGASSLNILYSGTGYLLVPLFRRRAASILSKLDNDGMVDGEQFAFSGWMWNLPRFTNIL
jgi:hypothetical protein